MRDKIIRRVLSFVRLGENLDKNHLITLLGYRCVDANIRLGRIPFLPPFRLRCCHGKGRCVQVLGETLHLTELKQRTRHFTEEPRKQRFRIL